MKEKGGDFLHLSLPNFILSFDLSVCPDFSGTTLPIMMKLCMLALKIASEASLLPEASYKPLKVASARLTYYTTTVVVSRDFLIYDGAAHFSCAKKAHDYYY